MKLIAYPGMEVLRTRTMCTITALPHVNTETLPQKHVKRALIAPNASMAWIQCPSLIRGRMTLPVSDETVTLFILVSGISNDGQLIENDGINIDFLILLRQTCKAWVRHQSRLTITIWSGAETMTVSVEDFFNKEYDLRDECINLFNSRTSLYQLFIGIELSGVANTEGDTGVADMLRCLEFEPIMMGIDKL